ncbi:hypothetical protein [Pinisolibacter aquiterrae]|uniref:hypothetical protein n=1 Tax=Pinisolibacter aquiterrae TaxID=2815579 RepID=UPI001C3C7816|nr:hypothetical protein [Pinisolibacter aquiterrae]MBV5263522.1 hypothetical protein [Pinisolibacter aquiterrae]MCC8237424.1 hypothetical protein [Pinisolibacter aquiterrae]
MPVEQGGRRLRSDRPLSAPEAAEIRPFGGVSRIAEAIRTGGAVATDFPAPSRRRCTWLMTRRETFEHFNPSLTKTVLKSTRARQQVGSPREPSEQAGMIP